MTNLNQSLNKFGYVFPCSVIMLLNYNFIYSTCPAPGWREKCKFITPCPVPSPFLVSRYTPSSALPLPINNLDGFALNLGNCNFIYGKLQLRWLILLHKKNSFASPSWSQHTINPSGGLKKSFLGLYSHYLSQPQINIQSSPASSGRGLVDTCVISWLMWLGCMADHKKKKKSHMVSRVNKYGIILLYKYKWYINYSVSGGAVPLCCSHPPFK